MRQRCSHRNKYISIGVCDKWSSFIEFKNDMYESYLKHVDEFGERNTTIDRIENDKGYYKGNCRWATIKVQSRNRYTNRLIEYGGHIVCLTELSEITGISRDVLKHRLNSGWSPIDAVNKPIDHSKNWRVI